MQTDTEVAAEQQTALNGCEVADDLEDKEIILQFGPLKNIKTKGHQMPDGWWYAYLPYDKEWHFVPNKDVQEVITDGEVSN